MSRPDKLLEFIVDCWMVIILILRTPYCPRSRPLSKQPETAHRSRMGSCCFSSRGQVKTGLNLCNSGPVPQCTHAQGGTHAQPACRAVPSGQFPQSHAIPSPHLSSCLASCIDLSLHQLIFAPSMSRHGYGEFPLYPFPAWTLHRFGQRGAEPRADDIIYRASRASVWTRIPLLLRT